MNKSFASPNTNKGIPDLIGVLNGIYVALEVKRPEGGKPTPVQLEHLQRIANAGGLAFVTNDADLIKVLKNKTKHYADHDPKLRSKKIHVDHLSLNKAPTVTQASHAWQQTKGDHSLQLLPQK